MGSEVIPPLPDGFVLKGDTPPLPPGFRFTGGDRPSVQVDAARAAGEKSLAEGQDTALKTLPMVGAVVASHLTGAGEAADVALLTARYGPTLARLIGLGLRGSVNALGAAGGSAVESGARVALGDPNAPKSLMEASHRAAGEATDFFQGQMIGEGVIGAAKEAVPILKYAAKGSNAIAKRLPGGRMAMEAIASHKADLSAAALAAAKAEGQAVKEQFVNGLSSISPEEMYGKAGALPNHFEEAFNASSTKLKEAAQLVGKNVETDVQSLRKPILALENARTKTGEPLIYEFTSPSTEYRQVVDKAGRGAEAKGTVVGELIPPPGKPGLVPPNALANNPVKVLIDFIKDGEKAPLDLIMEARGNISERLFDPATPKDAKKLYAALVPPGRSGPVDTLIKQTMEEQSPGSSKAWDTYLQFHADGAKLKEGALYTAMERNPTALPKYIVPMDPSRVTDLRKVTELAGKPEVFDETRRRWLEAMVTSKDGQLDLSTFRANLKNYGTDVVENLFQTQGEKATLNNLKRIGDNINSIQNEVGAVGEKKRASLANMVGLAAATMLSGGGGGAHIGGGLSGTLIGAGSALTIGYVLPGMVVRAAESPRLSMLLTRAINKLDDPKAIMDFVRAAKAAGGGAKAVAQSASEAMQPSH